MKWFFSFCWTTRSLMGQIWRMWWMWEDVISKGCQFLCCLFKLCVFAMSLGNGTWRVCFPRCCSWILRWRHTRVLHYTSLLIDCCRWATHYQAALHVPEYWSHLLSSRKCHPEFLWTRTVIMFSLHGLPFHLWSLMVKPGPVSSN